ncbi:hypothetical protein OF83DRAFT_1063551, partial [Amylostereum chailletii]
PFFYVLLPRHAAASYGHLHILEYLISKGGDVNVVDNDGDTPLYTVETVETARFLVEHGAIVRRQNHEGVSPAEHLEEDFPQVARYLASLDAPASQSTPSGSIVAPQPSQHHQEIASEQLTSSLMNTVHGIMTRAEADGHDPEDELRAAVSRTVLEGVAAGYGMGATMDDGQATIDGDRRLPPGDEHEPGEGTKRMRFN